MFRHVPDAMDPLDAPDAVRRRRISARPNSTEHHARSGAGAAATAEHGGYASSAHLPAAGRVSWEA